MSASWKRRREGGGSFAVWLIRGIGCLGGRALARLLLAPIALYFTLRRPAERRDSRDYLTRVLGRPATFRDVYRHVLTFSQTTLDRLFLLRGDTGAFDIRATGLDPVHRLMDMGRGVLLFGSHLGSFEVLRVVSRQRPNAKLRVVLDRAHSAAIMRVFDALNPEIAANVIDAGQDGPAIMFEIQQAMAEGALVALLVDRVQPGEDAVQVPFLGAPAPFPVAPWYIAAVLQAPVALVFGLYRGGNRYDLAFEAFSDGLSIARRDRAAAVPALVARFAARLEHHARSAPFNWFNFYDFWSSDDGDAAGTAGNGRRPAAGVGGGAGAGAAAAAAAAPGGTADRVAAG